ncbi:MAG: DNA polymerase III subunit delta [Erysipelotrichaceae bacterium]|nr:DNA polymerase III subunit delta [Erysipelotrichaceae bacterium]
MEVVSMNYVLYGKEQYLISKRIQEIVSECVSSQESVMTLDMQHTSLQFILEEAMMLPLFEDHKVLILPHASFEEDDPGITELMEFCQEGDSFTTLIFVCDEVNTRKKVYKELMKLMKFEELKPLGDVDRKQYVNMFLKKNKVDITESAKTYLLASLPKDMQQMISELDKLALYKDKIDDEAIRLLITRPLEDKVFELVNAITSHNMKKALAIWQDFLMLNKDVLQLMGAFASQFRFCYQVNVLRKEGLSNAEITERLDCNPDRVTITLRKSSNVSTDKYLYYLKELAQLDSDIKNGRIEPKLGFELFLLKVGGR